MESESFFFFRFFAECPTFTVNDEKYLGLITYWVDGVVTCIMALTGLIANVTSAMILGK